MQKLPHVHKQITSLFAATSMPRMVCYCDLMVKESRELPPSCSRLCNFEEERMGVGVVGVLERKGECKIAGTDGFLQRVTSD